MLVDLFGMAEEPNAFMGQDMLADDACRFVLLPQSFGRGYLAMRFRDLKVILELQAGTTEVFDLAADPEERSPLAFHDWLLAAEMTSFAVRSFNASSRAISEDRVYPP